MKKDDRLVSCQIQRNLYALLTEYEEFSVVFDPPHAFDKLLLSHVRLVISENPLKKVAFFCFPPHHCLIYITNTCPDDLLLMFCTSGMDTSTNLVLPSGIKWSIL